MSSRGVGTSARGGQGAAVISTPRPCGRGGANVCPGARALKIGAAFLVKLPNSPITRLGAVAMSDEAFGSFVLTVIFLLFFLALIPAVIAAKKGRSFFLWYCYGYVLWIIALVHAIMSEPAYTCRSCAEAIKPQAKVCPHCQRDLVDPPQARRSVGVVELGGL